MNSAVLQLVIFLGILNRDQRKTRRIRPRFIASFPDINQLLCKSRCCGLLMFYISRNVYL